MPNLPDRYGDRTPARRVAETLFQRHAQVYTLVNVFLVAIWLVTGAGTFWPIWPILGWGLALGLQGAATYGGRGRD
jgi:hypothetical protein